MYLKDAERAAPSMFLPHKQTQRKSREVVGVQTEPYCGDHSTVYMHINLIAHLKFTVTCQLYFNTCGKNI